MPGITTSGDAELAKGLIRSNSVIYREMEFLMQFLVRTGTNLARANAPVGPTGQLQASIGGEASGRSGFMAAQAPYALFPEMGITRAGGYDGSGGRFFYPAYRTAVYALGAGLLALSGTKILGAMVGRE